MSEHAELIENAWVEYLKNIDPPPWLPMITNNGEPHIFPGENNLAKDGQNIVAYVEDLGPEEPPLSGNRTSTVVIRLKTPVIKKVNPTDTDYLAAHKAAAASLQDAILDTNLPDLLTAAIADFCCFGIVDRTPFRDQDANAWTSGWRVMLHSCPSAVA